MTPHSVTPCACGERKHRDAERCWRCWDSERGDVTRGRIAFRLFAVIGQAVAEYQEAERVVMSSSMLGRQPHSDLWIGDMRYAPKQALPHSLTGRTARDRALRLLALRGDVVLSGRRGIVLRRGGRGHIIATKQEGAQC